jgi:mannose-6-phosphate isomerase-like protein (cupin superfamily)
MAGCTVRRLGLLDPALHFEKGAGLTTPEKPSDLRAAIVLPPGGGRAYPMGRINAIFKADGPETNERYSISEWWLEPHTKGPGAHAHPEDDIFYVIDGTMTILVNDSWIDAPTGSFVLVPAGMTHDFENRGSARAGLLNFSYPGDFERHMPSIVEWFKSNPLPSAGIRPPAGSTTAQAG